MTVITWTYIVIRAQIVDIEITKKMIPQMSLIGVVLR